MLYRDAVYRSAECKRNLQHENSVLLWEMHMFSVITCAWALLPHDMTNIFSLRNGLHMIVRRPLQWETGQGSNTFTSNFFVALSIGHWICTSAATMSAFLLQRCSSLLHFPWRPPFSIRFFHKIFTHWSISLSTQTSVSFVQKKSLIYRSNIHRFVFICKGRKSLTTTQGLKKEYSYNKILKDLKREFFCNGTVVQGPELGQVNQYSRELAFFWISLYKCVYIDMSYAFLTGNSTSEWSA
jgi:hypothetical protein